ncbi:hypothetical protein BLA6993_04727 [Burkholderia lata]|nr:hypothetical protein BLA6993_04727 [Burkholderia lata]
MRPSLKRRRVWLHVCAAKAGNRVGGMCTARSHASAGKADESSVRDDPVYPRAGAIAVARGATVRQNRADADRRRYRL